MPTRILIVTAAFGEGHNSAARHLAMAAAELGAECRVEDPCMLGAPLTTRWLCKGYRQVTTHHPKLWHRIYRSTAKVDFSKPRLSLMRRPERKLAGLIEELQPDAVVSTYPLYPYFLDRILSSDSKCRVITVVTDSLEINSAWLNAPSDAWLVTDAETRRQMVDRGLEPHRVIDTGFCVDPKFSRVDPLSPDCPVDPFRVLYFATPKLPHVRRISKAILNADPRTTVTIVLGRNVRLLHGRAKEIKDRFPGRVRIKGWTRKVPELLSSHHLVVGKAGGATVHEAIAASCPMLVHHLVPGQEEGNLDLLKQIGGGSLASRPDAIRNQIADMLKENARAWRSMKSGLIRHGHKAGGLAAARYIIDKIQSS